MTEVESNNDLVQIASNEGLLAMLTSALKQVDAIATGAIGTEKLHLLMVPGRLIQAARNRDFIKQLASELDDLRAKGRIKPDFNKARMPRPHCRSCWQPWRTLQLKQ